jgi:hypothetical protein
MLPRPLLTILPAMTFIVTIARAGVQRHYVVTRVKAKAPSSTLADYARAASVASGSFALLTPESAAGYHVMGHIGSITVSGLVGEPLQRTRLMYRYLWHQQDW